MEDTSARGLISLDDKEHYCVPEAKVEIIQALIRQSKILKTREREVVTHRMKGGDVSRQSETQKLSIINYIL